MFEIKKCVYKVMTIVLALLVVLNTSAIGVLADSVNPDEVTPKPGDYEIAQNSDGGVTITGLKKDYLGGLSTEQKQNIRLVIPEKIGEKEVTAIGNNAFSYTYNTGCGFVYLDISQASHLKSIGTHSFDGASQLRQNLELPENVETIDAYAFNNCGFTGELRIPAKVKVIGESAFRQSNSYNGFSGTLKIPASVKSIGKVAFSNQRCITGVDLSVCTLDSLGTSVFKGTGLQGSLCIPNTIKTIGDGAFKDTFLETIYLPNDIMVENNSFDSCSKLNAIICNQSDYKILSDKLSTSSKAKLGYPITVDFDDGKGGVYKSRECLYNLPYNYEKDDSGIWKPNSSYRFPKVIGSNIKAWALAPSSAKTEIETERVTSNQLYAIVSVPAPTITYSEGINKTYDGTPATLSVSVKHPAGKKFAEAGPGDVIFQYWWYLNVIGGSDELQKGFDEDTLELEDVILPEAVQSSGMSIRVWVYWYYVNDEYKAKYVDRTSYDFPVYYNSAESIVNPTVSNDHFYVNEDGGVFPQISLSDGDTNGTIEWNEGQNLVKGQHEYQWTFTPEKNSFGSSNYKIKTGTYTLTGDNKEETIKNVEEQLKNLPDVIEPEKVTKDEKNAILDAFIYYESLPEDIKNEVKSKTEKLYDSIEKASIIKTAVETDQSLNVDNKEELVRNVGKDEAIGLKNKTIKECVVKLIAETKEPEEIEREAIEELIKDGAKIAESFDVKVKKEITSSDGTKSETILNSVSKPIKLVFDVPKSLQSASRKFSIVRLHSNEDGTTTGEKLDDEDNNPATITVTSDKFSTYTIVYTEEKPSDSNSGGISNIYNIVASAGEHGSITPSGSAYAYYGSSKTYEFTPEEGYQVSDVIVDGVSVGPMLSYTFEKITKAHTIEVVFQAVADDQDRIINGIKNTTIKASSSVKKGAITIKWKKSAGFKVDYYQVFRSKKKNTGYGTKPFYSTKTSVQKSYKNTKNLKKGTRYYYKVRGVRTIDGKKVFTKWSNKTWRIAK